MDQGDENVTDIIDIEDDSGNFNGMKIVQISIGTMGIITNAAVVIVFLNDRKLRRKIPNICIINQVGTIYDSYTIHPNICIINQVSIYSYIIQTKSDEISMNSLNTNIITDLLRCYDKYFFGVS